MEIQMPLTKSKRVAVVAWDVFTDIDLVQHWEYFRRVDVFAGKRDALEVKLLGTKPSHISWTGLTYEMHGSIDELNEFDGVIFGSGWGMKELIKDPTYLKKIRDGLDLSRQFVGTQCLGSVILGAAGFLDNRPVTRYVPALPWLSTYPCELIDRPFVISGNLASASGCRAAPALSHWMLTKLLDEEIADTVLGSARLMGFDNTDWRYESADNPVTKPPVRNQQFAEV
jgi:transcriptional regulator GlxA family with amidase domain